MRRIAAFSFLTFLLLTAGCGSVSQAEAETKALEFVGQRGKFYFQGESGMVVIEEYDMKVVDSVELSDGWQVSVEIRSLQDNDTKTGVVRVVVDSRGEASLLKS